MSTTKTSSHSILSPVININNVQSIGRFFILNDFDYDNPELNSSNDEICKRNNSYNESVKHSLLRKQQLVNELNIKTRSYSASRLYNNNRNNNSFING